MKQLKKQYKRYRCTDDRNTDEPKKEMNKTM